MPYQVSRSAQSRRAIKTISKRVGIWNEDDDDVEEKEGIVIILFMYIHKHLN